MTVYRSLAYSAADSYVAVALQLLSTVILARILTPAEVGTFAVAAVFTALAGAFRNFGITEYLIQEPVLTPETVRAALAANIIVSWSMGLILFVSAPWIASFFQSQAVADVLAVQSISFLLIPFGAITLAYFRRELNMKPVFIASILSNATVFGVSVTLALNGFGHMSLAWSGLAGVCVSVAVSLAFRPPELPFWPSLKGAARAFHFGKHASGIYLFGQLGNGAPEMIIGRAEGVVSVAFFSRANGLLELFNKLVLNAIWPVVLPVFAKRQRETGGLKSAFLAGVSYLTVVSWPLLFLMGLAAYPAIRIFYGPQWMESVLLAQVLCVSAALAVPYHLTKESLIARGEVKESNYLQMAVQLARIVGVLCVFPFGLVGAAVGIVAASALAAWLSHRALRRSIGLSVADMAAELLPSLRITLLSTVPAALLTWAVPPDADNFVWVGLGAGALVSGAWCVAMRHEQHPLWQEAMRLGRAGFAKLAARRG